ncbi:MAG: beta-lactamase family protein [Acidobacteriota bacterium]|nr:beta-lactamase family protein [Acidobacteriota bacterium]
MIHETKPNPAISSLLAERIDAGDFPSATYLVAERGQIVFTDVLGLAVRQPTIPATVDTVYDLASLTKALITGLLCALRIEAGELTLDSSVAHYLPEFDRVDKRAITIRELLTHTSGLPAWRPLYVLMEGRPNATISTIASLDLEYAPGTQVLYSDLGFITLGLLLERLTGTVLAGLSQREIFEPLKLNQTFFNPEKARQTGIAACEIGNNYERQTCNEMGLQYQSWREGLIWGEVHDGNAYFLGGAAGHAGLFSTASETLRIAQQFIAEQTELLRPETCTLFRTNFTKGLEEDRSIAWKLASSPESSAGPDLAPDSFGHAGFTGTSCWIDPAPQRVFILLTNRTHIQTLPFANINSVRRQFHSLATAALK